MILRSSKTIGSAVIFITCFLLFAGASAILKAEERRSAFVIKGEFGINLGEDFASVSKRIAMTPVKDDPYMYTFAITDRKFGFSKGNVIVIKGKVISIGAENKKGNNAKFQFLCTSYSAKYNLSSIKSVEDHELCIAGQNGTQAKIVFDEWTGVYTEVFSKEQKAVYNAKRDEENWKKQRLEEERQRQDKDGVFSTEQEIKGIFGLRPGMSLDEVESKFKTKVMSFGYPGQYFVYFDSNQYGLSTALVDVIRGRTADIFILSKSGSERTQYEQLIDKLFSEYGIKCLKKNDKYRIINDKGFLEIEWEKDRRQTRLSFRDTELKKVFNDAVDTLKRKEKYEGCYIFATDTPITGGFGLHFGYDLRKISGACKTEPEKMRDGIFLVKPKVNPLNAGTSMVETFENKLYAITIIKEKVTRRDANDIFELYLKKYNAERECNINAIKAVFLMDRTGRFKIFLLYENGTFNLKYYDAMISGKAEAKEKQRNETKLENMDI